MATFNLLCKVYSQIELEPVNCSTCRDQYIHSTNTDNNLVEINEEMSELLDKQVWQPNAKLNKALTTKVGGVTGSV